jgi:beta-lactamase class A
MTAMVALDHDPTLTRSIKLINLVGSSLPNGQYTRRQLFDAMLVRSDNAAAETLAEDFPGGRAAFVRAMNRRAVALGMTSTRFQDPSGLSRNNVGTAGDVGTLVTQLANTHSYEKSVCNNKFALSHTFDNAFELFPCPIPISLCCSALTTYRSARLDLPILLVGVWPCW